MSPPPHRSTIAPATPPRPGQDDRGGRMVRGGDGPIRWVRDRGRRTRNASAPAPTPPPSRMRTQPHARPRDTYPSPRRYVRTSRHRPGDPCLGCYPVRYVRSLISGSPAGYSEGVGGTQADQVQKHRRRARRRKRTPGPPPPGRDSRPGRETGRRGSPGPDLNPGHVDNRTPPTDHRATGRVMRRRGSRAGTPPGRSAPYPPDTSTVSGRGSGTGWRTLARATCPGDAPVRRYHHEDRNPRNP